MTYDSENNPRYLPPDTFEINPQLEELVSHLGSTTAALEWTKEPQFQEFTRFLEAEIERAKNRALEVTDTTPLAELRGKVRAFEWILAFPNNLRATQIRELEAQDEISRLQEDTLEGG